ncbi:MAG TPA: CAP domain-containing protein [Terriglobales bacterium]|nr:CAP domain-containing protein [Terriglobales bacterium]
MKRALTAALAIFLIGGPASAKTRKPKPAAFVASVAQFSFAYEADAENQLFALANQVRAEAGVPAFQRDEGLTQAAREHAAAMAAQQQLSHQFSGEASVQQRLTAATPLHIDRAGENVAYAATADQAHDNLMHSPPHRENLLNPAYNVAGFGVVRSGDSLYVVQDFAHGSQINSSQQSENMVAENVMRMREKSDRSPLQRLDGSGVRAVACSMAQADSLNVSSNPGQYFLRYTSMQPETLPASAAKTIADRGLRAFAVGACYAQTVSYPGGVYWIAVVFY